MAALVDLLKKIYPDILCDIQQRYRILHSVELFQPIGRRGLAEQTHLTERNIRSEIDLLQAQGLIAITPKGMHLTTEGTLLLEQLSGWMNELNGLNVLEMQLKEKLQLKDVVIVSGNSDEDAWVKKEMGKAAFHFLQKIVKPDDILAVTGGTTMFAVAEAMKPFPFDGNILFVPARGGIGEQVENQANTIVATMAKRTNGAYRMLFVPDLLSEASYKSIIQEPAIDEILGQIKSASIVLHGVGDAIRMAHRRNAASDVIDQLHEKEAVGEAFGYYFDSKGNIVHKIRTVGLQLKDLNEKKYVVTVAGGKSKARAIASYYKLGKSDVLITDEAAAKVILRDNPL
ncbi:sugar-binding domain-containing protein [Virgibacillus sp. 179-BFC.A HS]|uniref:Sugar-binding domain-containing protein n=1 Tax=Tigheibacillus jepli TaxID=3035914 RepID=A0ABU5CFN3_9BACI|nr:sugar-binding domain-containing protein [Virgibacillus sp. 179-BFC.A HS]MDY0405138.1 sugar-binding domain-containing protein [Virgibacillus sp. 179-BFC.A HS]